VVDRNRKTPVRPTRPFPLNIKSPNDRVPRPDPRVEPATGAPHVIAARLPGPPRMPTNVGEPTSAPASEAPPVPSSDTALQIKVRDPKAWGEFVKSWAVVITATGTAVAAVIGGTKVQELTTRVEAQGKALEAATATVAKLSADLDKSETLISEQDCQIGVLANVARRLGYSTGFAADIEWDSQRLDDGNDAKTAPLWRTRKTCVKLP
jgi:hypothetical protein